MVAILSDTDKQEQFSTVYLKALATSAGFTVAEQNLDRDGVDLIVRGGASNYPQLDWQLKATKNLPDAVDGTISYPLKVRNYDLLRVQTVIPRYLMVFDMPLDANEWCHCDATQLVLRRKAYWVSLAGKPETTNTTSVSISIPEDQILTVEVLTELMEKARDGVSV